MTLTGTLLIIVLVLWAVWEFHQYEEDANRDFEVDRWRDGIDE